MRDSAARHPSLHLSPSEYGALSNPVLASAQATTAPTPHIMYADCSRPRGCNSAGNAALVINREPDSAPSPDARSASALSR
ncbi:hypothetical protein G6F68_012212 [Rhizopus microsporus]|nr:hypothetical protein G6F68_012212 [Rhizopus microsporus]